MLSPSVVLLEFIVLAVAVLHSRSAPSSDLSDSGGNAGWYGDSNNFRTLLTWVGFFSNQIIMYTSWYL